jgi:ferric-dicitrate binding protein FerR (iron transport regulator)
VVNEHLYAEMAGRLLRRRWQGAPRRAVAVVVPAKHRLVGAVEQALLDRRRKRRRQQRVGAAVAGVLLLVVAAFTLSTVGGKMAPASWGRGALAARAPRAPSSARSMTRQLFLRDSGAILSAGVRLTASSGRAIHIQSHAGTELTMEPDASVSIVESGQTDRLALHSGALAVRVAKAPVEDRVNERASEHFIVQTTDTEIEVRGTRLRVVVGADRTSACGESLVTRVTVSEGWATVRSGGREIKLVSGDEWRTTCPVTKQALGSEMARRVSPSPAAVSALALAVPAPAPSSLDGQNELFSAAMRAKRGGRTGDALDLFAQFLYEYPDSPLVESAMVQRMRLAAAEDPTWAMTIATRYLARFPDGYARIEAQEIVDNLAQL